MNKTNKQTFIDNELKELWPQWEWPNATLRIWFGVLSNFDYDVAQQAIQCIYTNGSVKWQKQLVPVFIKKAKSLRMQKTQANSRTVLLYSLQSEENPANVQQFWITLKTGIIPNEDVIMREAEKNREDFIATYGGNWIIVREWVKLAESVQESTE